MAEAASAVLDTKFLKALSDPTRVEILKKLINVGACDISTIAQGLSQDRSVISRHLATLERAHICASTKQGRHVLYDLDGPYIVAKVQSILDAIAAMAELCQPFSDLPQSGAA
ncbi:MAG: transcriptional regulator [Acidimicrobiales bacterium]|nr:helix-turn-helix transcriptional regulator [Hyphomonadaceae bacterium]RZV44823.1 MAG: transcriptional regulator [Acidimicrobiales bacterium]